jgi:hypothetical protein
VSEDDHAVGRETRRAVLIAEIYWDRKLQGWRCGCWRCGCCAEAAKQVAEIPHKADCTRAAWEAGFKLLTDTA